MIRFFIGEVYTVDPDTHTITFNIPYWADDIGGNPPMATPAMKLSRYPQEGDEVLILQPDTNFEIFMYFLTPDDNFDISMNYGPACIKIVNNGDDDNPDYSISIDTSNGSTINMDDGMIQLKRGNQTITLEDGSTTITSPANISVSGMSPATPGAGPFCAIPNCLFTGAPHGGNTFTSTSMTFGSGV